MVLFSKHQPAAALYWLSQVLSLSRARTLSRARAHSLSLSLFVCVRACMYVHVCA
jgi:hypothetical protein